MDISHQIILIGALLLLISILATHFSSRIGMPILLAFLMIGMLAGEQGPGRIIFQDIQYAHLIGTLALAIILFDAGLHTKENNLRVGLLPALSLSTVGILVTIIIAGLFAAWILNLSWLEGLLLGAMIAPTDAAAVFSLLQASDVKLRPRVAATLEIESGSNDPIAVLLTISIISLLKAGQTTLTIAVLKLFLLEISIGITVGITASLLIIYFSTRIKLKESLYPLFILSSGLLIFATTNLLGGSGYLAIYLAGILIGNSHIHQRKDTLQLHDSLAWLSQISMFLTLGLLVTPSALLPSMPSGLLIALVLILIARPLAVWLSLLPFKFNWREQVFFAWVGLRGAVPIILALNPLLVGLKYAELYFNVTFFIVVVSIALQGWTLQTLARKLHLEAD